MSQFFSCQTYFGVFLFLTGCSLSDSAIQSNHGSNGSTAHEETQPVKPSARAADLQKLTALWQERTRQGVALDYPIGAGDIVEISVPAIPDIGSRLVRVSGEGTISLPFVGIVKAEGLQEEELAEAIRTKLEKYMYTPRVSLFVKEYRSRQVAVLGAVGRPGHYSLSSGADTIMDVISRAGGISPAADPRIHLIPAEVVDKEKAREVMLSLPENSLARDPALLILKRTDPILIDIKELAYGGHQNYLSLPVRPGDIIMVPGGGQILVEGWVEKPGAYPVSPGMTVSGIVVAAGGVMFPADKANVKIIRTEKEGNKTVLSANLESIKAGIEPDVALQGGDIVEIASTPSRLIPYGLYRFFSTIVNVGVGGTVPIIR